MGNLDQRDRRAEKIRGLVNLYGEGIDYKAYGITLHLPDNAIDKISPGTLGLLLGELLSGRYGYAANFSKRAEEAIEEERTRLQDLGRTHPGPEHGPRRHYINHIMQHHVPSGTDLLDFGCGGGFYKEYYSKCDMVTALDVNLHALLHLRAFFPDASRHALVWAPLCLTDFQDGSFPSILLSAVIGYVPLSLTDLILDECCRLLALLPAAN